MAKATTFKIGRDSGTGKFETVKAAKADKQGAQVETIRIPKKRG